MLTVKEFQKIHQFLTPEALYINYVEHCRKEVDQLKRELLTIEHNFVKTVTSKELIDNCRNLFNDGKQEECNKCL